MADSSAIDVRRAAMDLLARREHSQRELAQKLSRRFSDRDQIQQQLEVLAGENLQSDARFAEGFIHQRIQRGQGPIRIRQELRQRGVADHLADTAFSDLEINWLDIAETALNRKFKGAPEDDKDRAHRYRFLLQRGFSAELCRELIGF